MLGIIRKIKAKQNPKDEEFLGRPNVPANIPIDVDIIKKLTRTRKDNIICSSDIPPKLIDVIKIGREDKQIVKTKKI